MTAPDRLLNLIRNFESLRLQSYRCPAGVWTIGYGATGPEVVPGLIWTEEQAETRLQRDALIAYLAASSLCSATTGQPLVALADFCFNLGATKFAGSTLRRKVNQGDAPGAVTEIKRWVYGGGVKRAGLVARRKIEAAMLLAG